MNQANRNGMSSSSRKGFVLPSVIFAIAIMSVIVVVALNTASDERRASRATRESTFAMYAAEAGLRPDLWGVAKRGGEGSESW